MPAQNLPGLMLDRSHPLARGLVGWWPLNEGGGTRVADVGSYQNPGAFGNITPSSTSGWSGGPHGRAVRFDGSDDIISVPHSASLALTGDMSACAWVNVTSVANYRSVLIKGNGGAGYPAPFQITVGVTYSEISANFGNGSSQATVDSYPDTAVPLNQWTFIAATRLGSNVWLYMNGRMVKAGSIGAQAVTDAGTALGIGSRTPGTAYPMLGGIANVRLYNRALSASEVAQLYADPLAGARAPLGIARTFIGLLRSLTADRLHNRRFSRIYRRGES